MAVFVQVIATLSATRGYSTVAPFADCRTIVPNDDDRDLSAPRGTTTVYLDVSALNGTYIPEMAYSRKHMYIYMRSICQHEDTHAQKYMTSPPPPPPPPPFFFTSVVFAYNYVYDAVVLSRRVSYNGLLVQGRQASNLSQAAGNFTITCSETDKQRSQCVHVAPEVRFPLECTLITLCGWASCLF